MGLNIGDLSTLSSAELKIHINKSRKELFTKSYTSNVAAAERLKTVREETNKLVALVRPSKRKRLRQKLISSTKPAFQLIHETDRFMD